MNRKLHKTILLVLGAAAAVGMSSNASAQNANYISGTTSSNNPPASQAALTAIPTGSTYSATATLGVFTWDGNNNVFGQGWGWGHNANFYIFNLGSNDTTLDIKQTKVTGVNFNPAFTLWKTTGYSDPAFDSASGHTFSQVSSASKSGWLTNPAEGGVTGTLGYANSGPTGWLNGNGETVGAGSAGSSVVAGSSAELILSGLSSGGYLLVVGSDLACGTFAGNTLAACPTTFLSGSYNLTITPSVSAVPIPAAVWLFGSALAGLGVFGRRKSS
jgi:hypothetical protein